MKISSETIDGVLSAKIVVMEARLKALEELLIEKEPSFARRCSWEA